MTSCVAVGFYTPDYEPLARALEVSLGAQGMPHRFYCVPPTDWLGATRMKPVIVQRAFRDYPGSTLILMDVDCIVRGAIAPMLDFSGDVALYLATRRKGRRSIRTTASSRIIAFRPTPKAMALVASWQGYCARDLGDEQALMFAIASTAGLSVSQMDVAYAAREHDRVGSDAVIVHKSQRAMTQRVRWSWERSGVAALFLLGAILVAMGPRGCPEGLVDLNDPDCTKESGD